MYSETGDWRDRAACINADPELFFPVGETLAGDRQQIADAKKFCGSCLARDACYEYAITTNQDSGIWGNTTEKERRLIKRALINARRRRSVETTYN